MIENGAEPSAYVQSHRARLIEFMTNAKGGNALDTRALSWFRREVHRVTSRWVDPRGRVLDIGCGDGTLLEATGARHVSGIDIDERAIEGARRRNPHGSWCVGWFEDSKWDSSTTFDTVVLSGMLEQVYDIATVLEGVRRVSHRRTRLVITSYSRLAQPLLRLLEVVGIRARNPVENWIPPSEIHNLLHQSGFDLVYHERRILLPVGIPLVSQVVNRWLAPLPGLRHLCLINVTIASPAGLSTTVEEPMVSVVIAARNERENIGPLLDRLPALGARQEVIFVEGGSSDGTYERILEEVEQRRSLGYPFEIVGLKQSGKGKGDAVRAGFTVANGDILIILDADLSVPPEELPRFIAALQNGMCDFANGSRLVYPMDERAMQFLNLVGNRFFGMLFSYLLGQPIRDTLCGTKALWADDYRRIAANRATFGDFDPFGDFDLLFGAANLGLRIRDVPVHYKERVYGSTNISRFTHGLLLFRMSWIAARKLRFT